MGVLTGIDEAKNQISTNEIAFAGRLTSVKLTMSTRSLPPTNYYELQFEDNVKSIKGSVPTTNQFNYSQRGGSGHQENNNPAPVEPQSNHYYVAIYDSDRNNIKTLIEINDNDLSLL